MAKTTNGAKAPDDAKDTKRMKKLIRKIEKHGAAIREHGDALQRHRDAMREISTEMDLIVARASHTAKNQDLAAAIDILSKAV